MPFRSKPQFTGPDYLIAAAEQRKHDLPYAREFEEMAMTAVIVEETPGIPVSMLPGLAPRRDLEPHEQTAVILVDEAMRRALEGRDTESIRELARFGTSMAMRFDEHLRQIQRLPQRVVGVTTTFQE